MTITRQSCRGTISKKIGRFYTACSVKVSHYLSDFITLLQFSGEKNYPILPGLDDMPVGWATEGSPSSWYLPGEESDTWAEKLNQVFGSNGKWASQLLKHIVLIFRQRELKKRSRQSLKPNKNNIFMYIHNVDKIFYSLYICIISMIHLYLVIMA